ncbi:c-type cytochrome [Conexibacter woesei]|uniref:Cytochrome c class I n=1 Tax=Conexibacter woesei (strain DSM 14684 / CCUG 47730 / CIP 108061 / JCM 11494 / NBRC 100937 / ID131577) TaxID=469383 RepID=D3EZW2_CONWI|nr:c-type cytochrome [Conexibacter woesei]ADB49938.1 cytochrome c class I [Conexibacter woesei DSM 14684]
MSSRPARLFAVLCACLGLAVGFAACGGDGEDDKQGSIALTELPGNPENGSGPGRPADGRLAESGAGGGAGSEAPAGGGAADGDDEAEAGAGGGGTAANAEGKAIFTQSCAGCHTLSGAGANGSVGPNLDEAKPDQAAVAEKVRAGGGGMPSFGGQLEPSQIDAVAAYVAATAGS